MSPEIDALETAKTKARYNRIAPIYDLMELLPEQRFAPMRQKLWSLISGGQVLEVGVGTGKNFRYHPPEANVTGIDLSEGMLEQARRSAEKSALSIELKQMDVQRLDFPDDHFDAAVATFVFCSVPDSLRGLHELARVVKSGGKIVLLDHVRVDRPAFVGKLMDLLDPLVVHLMGLHINRRTEENVRRSGLAVERVESLAPLDLVKLIVARPDDGSHTSSTRDNHEQDATEAGK